MIKVRNRRSSGCYGAVCGTNGTEMMAIVLLSLSIFAILFQEAQPFMLPTSSSSTSRCRPQDPCFHRIGWEQNVRVGCTEHKRTQPSMKAQWKGSDDHDGTTNANSKTSRMSVPPGYKFFRRSGRRIGDAGDTTNQVSSYVPSGMSRAEYVALRKTETEQQQKMNYGAWGPRFKQTDRPDGDWMVMPNLWTLGQIGGNRNRNNQGVVNNGENEGSDPTGLRRIPSLARTYGPALVLGYVLVDCLFTAYALWKFDRLRDLAVLRRAHGPAYAVYHLFRSVLSLVARLPASQLLAAHTIEMRAMARPALLAVISRIQVAKLALAVLQAPLWNGWMERGNRRWLWSKNRFVVTVASAATAGLTLFGIALFR